MKLLKEPRCERVYQFRPEMIIFNGGAGNLFFMRTLCKQNKIFNIFSFRIILWRFSFLPFAQSTKNIEHPFCGDDCARASVLTYLFCASVRKLLFRDTQIVRKFPFHSAADSLCMSTILQTDALLVGKLKLLKMLNLNTKM